MFSAEQYRVLHEGAGLVARGDRGLLRLTGADRLAFLQGILTNDVAGLTPGHGAYAALLTANGRMIADIRVIEVGNATFLDVAASQAASLRERFDMSIFTEDVAVTDDSARFRQVGVHGPRARDVIAAALGSGADGLSGITLDENRRIGDAIVIASADFGVTGFDLLVPVDTVDATLSALSAAGAIAVGPDVAEVARIEAGQPRFGTDMDEDTIPLEAGIEGRAISLTKGCYVGQEIIIRMLHRGQGRVAKRLVGLILESSAPVPAAGDAIKVGERQVGTVTSATSSPRLSRPIAMGYVHRDFAEPGKEVAIVTSSGVQVAAVSGLPFGSVTPTSSS
jgi:folate-binding protein YgfZ